MVTVTKEDIGKGLYEVGIRQGDVVFVHSSLSSFGYVEGGADAVIDALLRAVGGRGTVVAPTFTWGKFRNIDTGVFDVAHTPCETGRIPDVFRRRPDAIRSRHICHSVAAIGPHAGDAMGEDYRSFGKGSCLHRLYGMDAWNLFLGCDLGSCTELHAVEEFMQVPYRYYRDFKGCTVRLPDGTEVASHAVEFLPVPDYRRWSFREMEPIFREHGILRMSRVGNARLVNARVRDIFDVGRTYLEKDILFFLTGESRALFRRAQERATGA